MEEDTRGLSATVVNLVVVDVDVVAALRGDDAWYTNLGSKTKRQRLFGEQKYAREGGGELRKDIHLVASA